MPSEKRSETISVMVTPSIKEEIDAIVAEDERTRSKVAGILLERGLQLYRKDKQLIIKDSKLGVIRAKTEDAPRKRKP